jgi:hypothetical protein
VASIGPSRCVFVCNRVHRLREGEGGIEGGGSGGGYGVEVDYLDRAVCFVWAVSRGLAGGVVVGEEEPEVCLFWAKADDVAEGGSVV